jgi:hypothetical protein
MGFVRATPPHHLSCVYFLEELPKVSKVEQRAERPTEQICIINECKGSDKGQGQGD